MRPKAYSYVRFSTPEQAQGDSQRRQIEAARKYAASHGLDLDETLTFEDLGMSAYRGTNVKVGALRKFLDRAEAGEIESGSYLLVESLDRISRGDVLAAQSVFLAIVNAGITLVTLNDKREYSTEGLRGNGTDLIIAIVTMIRAHEESAMKGRRLKASWVNKRANAANTPLTKLAPAWLRLDEKTGQFVVLKERAVIVRRIYRMTLKGIGQHAIAEKLNEERVPPFFSEFAPKRRRAHHWHRSYIKKLLANPSVTGTLVPHELDFASGKRRRKPLTPVPNYFPRIVDQETYGRVRAMRQSGKAPKMRARAGTINNLLAGLARCPINGATMTRVTKGPNGGRPALVCTTAKAGAGCVYHAVPQEQVERALIENIGWLIARAPAGNRDLDTKWKELEESRDAASDAIENLLAALSRAPSKALTMRLTEMEDEYERLGTEQQALAEQMQAAKGPLLRRKLADLETALTAAPIDRPLANALLRQVFCRVTIDWQAGALVFEWRAGKETVITFAWPHEAKKKAA